MIPDYLLAGLGVTLPASRALVEAGLIRRSARGVAFRHDLCRLAVRSVIPPGAEPRLHRRLIDAHEASGYVDPMGALIIGVMAGAVCYLSAVWMKRLFKYDDALDAWGVHGVGGALGAILTGVFATSAINPSAKGWLADGNLHQMLIQLIDVGAVLLYCGAATFLILKAIDVVIGLRVPTEVWVTSR